MIAKSGGSRYRTIAAGCAILIGSSHFSVRGNETDAAFTEHVVLHDGRAIEVQRTFSAGSNTWPRNLLNLSGPFHHSLETFNPDTGKRVRWTGPTRFEPVLIDFDQGVAYVVIRQASTFGNLKQFGCPPIPYVFFALNAATGTWTQVAPTAVPSALLRENLLMDERGRPDKLRHDPIPVDFASWKDPYKNHYRVSHFQDGCSDTVPSREDPSHPQSPGHPATLVPIEILETRSFDPPQIVDRQSAFDPQSNNRCNAMVIRVPENADNPNLRGWLLFVNDPTKTKKAQGNPGFCSDQAIWFYDREPGGRLALTKFAATGDFMYRITFALPTSPKNRDPFPAHSSIRIRDGEIAFEVWDTDDRLPDGRLIRDTLGPDGRFLNDKLALSRVVKLRLREPDAPRN